MRELVDRWRRRADGLRDRAVRDDGLRQALGSAAQALEDCADEVASLLIVVGPAESARLEPTDAELADAYRAHLGLPDDTDPLGVRCVECNAAPDAPCINADGAAKVHPHAIRRRHAVRAWSPSS